MIKMLFKMNKNGGVGIEIVLLAPLFFADK